jgi:putative ABC transport system permease protein
LLPALPGAVIGVPAGVGLYAAVSNGGEVTMPSALWVGMAIVGTLLAMTLLTAIPARFGTHSSVAKILRSAD